MEDQKANAGIQGNSDPSTNNANANQNGADPKKTDAGSQGFNPDVLNEGDWDKVFSSDKLWTHPRFKALADASQKLKQLEADQQKANEEKLKEQGKLKELLEVKEETIKKLQNDIATSRVDSLITSEAVKKGVIDPEAVTKLIDRNLIKVDGEKISGVTEALASLIEAKPYLANKSGATMGSGSNPSSNTGSPAKFKLSQVQDPIFYREHEKEIDQAFRLGLIENDK